MGKRGFQVLPSGKHRWQGRDPLTGRRVSITAPTRLELEIRVKRVRSVADQLKYGDIDPRHAAAQLRPALGRSLTVGAVWERYFKGLAGTPGEDAARSTYERRIAPYLGDRMVWELNDETLRGWETKLREQDFAPMTIRSAWDYLRAAVRLAIDAGDVHAWPWSRFRMRKPKPRRPREATTELDSFAAMLLAARAHDERRWKRGQFSDRTARVLVMGLCGLRQAEACGLAWDCVELEAEGRELVHVRYQARRGWRKRSPDRPRDEPKWGSVRTQRLHPSVVVALKHQREQLVRRGWYRLDGPVFPGAGGKWRTGRECVKPAVMRELAQAAGLARWQNWTTHSLRHSFATLETIASGGDLMGVKQRTGHADVKTLQGYLHAAGHGLPTSKLPELPPELVPMPTEVVRAFRAPGEALTELARGVGERAAACDDERRAERKAAREAARRPFEELAAEWLESGRRSGRPKAVTEAARNAYTRAYQRVIKAGGSKDEAAAAGRRAKRASLGAWGQALTRAERVRGQALAAEGA